MERGDGVRASMKMEHVARYRTIGLLARFSIVCNSAVCFV